MNPFKKDETKAEPEAVKAPRAAKVEAEVIVPPAPVKPCAGHNFHPTPNGQGERVCHSCGLEQHSDAHKAELETRKIK